ncbi:recombinase family protein [Rhodococcus sp. LW-XY12]|uniref:recombinase family protein n=1 Tax=Rhodococcus sp. LW-XY12 TaxID=2856851 RepID=UPI001C5613C6|nr:recombinase family protein [Rhodococcus sp. LW-XY12]QXU51794.1 recombinase family protein [Rhodococcus sp. LW-XY12]
MLIGYARVSTGDQNPNHQIDALRRAGVADENIHVDYASGAKASRPQLDLVLRLLRDGDQLAITRLDRLGRSVLHLIGLGAQLREKGVGLKVLEQCIDTATAEGRAMFGMLSVLAELQRELIVANTRDGLAAARARGRKGGRPPKLTAEQVEHAQRLYDGGKHTVAQIAGLLGVRRTTLYGHLTKTDTVPAEAATPTGVNPRVSAVEHPAPPRKTTSRACPSCGHEPATRSEAAHQRADLAVTWLYLDPEDPDTIITRHHCRSCQPDDKAVDVACTICGDGPILAGEPGAGAEDGVPEPIQRWLTEAGWQTTPTLLCPDHV